MPKRYSKYAKAMLLMTGLGFILASLMNALSPDVMAGIVAISHGYSLHYAGIPLTRSRPGTLISTSVILIIMITFISFTLKSLLG